ncbi:hypothetical protein EK21DRAFT_106063 [Setomelanomma holmii]|uniref:Uncharacterized protein n=1 Tax=Setomelanomma holmii TaxID=210430 RepID=A0A9P4LQZ7_9PLEO|nr:hypothetical protein EK21DRAFT_106063 [Setomelanomma holmii]
MPTTIEMLTSIQQHFARAVCFLQPVANSMFNFILLPIILPLACIFGNITALTLDNLEGLVAHIDEPHVRPCQPKAVRYSRNILVFLFRLFLLARIWELEMRLKAIMWVTAKIDRPQRVSAIEWVFVPAPPAMGKKKEKKKKTGMQLVTTAPTSTRAVVVITAPLILELSTCTLPPAPVRSKRQSTPPTGALMSCSQHHVLFAFAVYIDTPWWVWDFNNAARYAVFATLYFGSWANINMENLQITNDNPVALKIKDITLNFKTPIVQETCITSLTAKEEATCSDSDDVVSVSFSRLDWRAALALFMQTNATSDQCNFASAAYTGVFKASHATKQHITNDTHVEAHTHEATPTPQQIFAAHILNNGDTGFVLARTVRSIPLWYSSVIEPDLIEDTTPRTRLPEHTLSPLLTSLVLHATPNSFFDALLQNVAAKRFFTSLHPREKALYTVQMKKYIAAQKMFNRTKTAWMPYASGFPWNSAMLAAMYPSWALAQTHFHEIDEDTADFCCVVEQWEAYRAFKKAEAKLQNITEVMKKGVVQEIKLMLGWDRQMAARQEKRVSGTVCVDALAWANMDDGEWVNVLRVRGADVTAPSMSTTWTFGSIRDMEDAFDLHRIHHADPAVANLIFEGLAWEGDLNHTSNLNIGADWTLPTPYPAYDILQTTAAFGDVLNLDTLRHQCAQYPDTHDLGELVKLLQLDIDFNAGSEISMPDFSKDPIDPNARRYKRNISRNHYGTREDGLAQRKRARIFIYSRGDRLEYAIPALIPTQTEFNFTWLHLPSWTELSHMWDWNMLDAPAIIYIDPDTNMKDQLGVKADMKRTASSADLTDDRAGKTKRVQHSTLEPSPNAVLGKRKGNHNPYHGQAFKRVAVEFGLAPRKIAPLSKRKLSDEVVEIAKPKKDDDADRV